MKVKEGSSGNLFLSESKDRSWMEDEGKAAWAQNKETNAAGCFNFICAHKERP